MIFRDINEPFTTLDPEEELDREIVKNMLNRATIVTQPLHLTNVPTLPNYTPQKSLAKSYFSPFNPLGFLYKQSHHHSPQPQHNLLSPLTSKPLSDLFD